MPAVPAVGQLFGYVQRTVRSYLRCFASQGRYFDPATAEGAYFAPISEVIPPMPLYVMCWVNIYRAGAKTGNAIHWHIHHWLFQGYVSVNSEGSATRFLAGWKLWAEIAGLEANYSATSWTDDAPVLCKAAVHCFNWLFAMELLLRFVSYGPGFKAGAF